MYRVNSKKNIEFSIGYIQKIIDYAVGAVSKIEVLDNDWDKLVEGTIKNSTMELSVPNGISEEIITALLKKS